jgi:hypothetical protein
MVSIVKEAPTPHSPPHCNSVQRPKDDQDSECGSEAGCELDRGIKEDVGHQRRPPPKTIGDNAEKKSSKRPHGQSQEEREGYRLHVGLKFLGDVFDDKDQDEEVKGIECPTQETRNDCASLLGSQGFELFKEIHFNPSSEIQSRKSLIMFLSTALRAFDTDLDDVSSRRVLHQNERPAIERYFYDLVSGQRLTLEILFCAHLPRLHHRFLSNKIPRRRLRCSVAAGGCRPRGYGPISRTALTYCPNLT